MVVGNCMGEKGKKILKKKKEKKFVKSVGLCF